jgi:drug/metabolite transporter (DMT)-like permease
MSPSTRSPAAWGPYLAAGGAILCWASLAAALGTSLDAVLPEQVLFHGMLAAGLALAAWDWARGAPLHRAWPGPRVALLGVYGIFGYHALLVFAFSLAPRVPANILNYTWPLWIILLGRWGRGGRLSGRALAGGLLGLAGVALVIGGGAVGDFDPLVHAAGLALALAAGFCWGSFTVLLRRWGPPGGNPMALFCLLSALAAGLLMLARGVPFGFAAGQIWLVLYIGIVPWGLAFALWDRAARGCDLRRLGLLSYFTPPLSTALLALVSGAAVGLPLAAGLALILAGSAWGGTAPRAAGGQPAGAPRS